MKKLSSYVNRGALLAYSLYLFIYNFIWHVQGPLGIILFIVLFFLCDTAIDYWQKHFHQVSQN